MRALGLITFLALWMVSCSEDPNAADSGLAADSSVVVDSSRVKDGSVLDDRPDVVVADTESRTDASAVVDSLRVNDGGVSDGRSDVLVADSGIPADAFVSVDSSRAEDGSLIEDRPDAAVADTGVRGDAAPDVPLSDAESIGYLTPEEDQPGFDLSTPPDSRWDTEPATITLEGGIEIIDPSRILAGRTVTASVLSPSSLAPARPGAIAAWDIQPTGEFAGVFYVRFPLPSARTSGEVLELWTFNSSEDEWVTQSSARVMPDGRRAIAAMWHFSPQALVQPIAARTAFTNGRDCNGSGTVVDPSAKLTIGQHLPASGEETTVGGRQIAYTHDIGRCVLSELSGQFVFKGGDAPPHDDEDRYADPAMVVPMAELGRLVAERSCGYLRLRITEVFDSRREHTGSSFHFEGRSADLTLCESTPSSTGCTGGKYNDGLGRLARLAATAGLSWSYFEDNSANNAHVHVSMRSGFTAATRAEALRRCYNRGALGLFRSYGAHGTDTAPPGHGGDARFEVSGTESGGQPASGTALRSDFGVAAGGAASSLPSQAGSVRIAGTVNLTSSSAIQCGYSFFLERTGRIVCPGCNVTIRARSGVRIDGVIDLSANESSASRNGGTLTVVQPTDLAPVLELPSIDVRGGDGLSTAVRDGTGAQGGSVYVSAMGDLVLGSSIGVYGLTPRLDHTVTSPPCNLSEGVPGVAGIITSGGAGDGRGGLVRDGYPGGAGGPIDISLVHDSRDLLGRAIFYNAVLATGGTPSDPLISPVEVCTVDLAPGCSFSGTRIGTGSLGGPGPFGKSVCQVNGGVGGTGGAGGALRIHTDAARSCPSLVGVASELSGINETGTRVGDIFHSAGGGCALTWTSAGGSGGSAEDMGGRAGRAGTISIP